MKERVERLATEIRQILSEIVTRQEIKDPRVQEAGLITVTHVRLTGDLRQATALFTVHGADAAALARVRDGLNHAGGYLRHRLGKELQVRAIPTVSFEIDRVFEQEAKVDALLKDIGTKKDRVGEEAASPPEPHRGGSGTLPGSQDKKKG
jgi:ribosome-binding factor A